MINGVKNGVRQGGVSYLKLFNFNQNKVIPGISKLLIGCSLNCTKVNISGYDDDLVLLALTSQAL